MEAIEHIPKTSLEETKTQSTIMRISKKISKLIVKELMKSEEKNNIIMPSMYVKNEIFHFPLDFIYDGTYIKCIFFKSSFFPEELLIYPGDLHDLFMNICINIEKIFASIHAFNVRNVDFEILPGSDPTRKSIILLSYNLVC